MHHPFTRKLGSRLRSQPRTAFRGLLLAFACVCLGQSATAAEDVLRSLEGPDIVIMAGEDRTVYEYRQNGQLRMVKIVPRIGRPYYLVPADETRGFGDLEAAQTLIPRWVIVEF